MSIKKVKLFKTPSLEENWIPLGVNTPSLPPLSLGIITAHLRGKGFDVDQDDLNQKVNNSNFHFGNKMDLSLLKDYERVINFLKGHDDKEIQSLVDSMASLTSLDGFDVYLISIGFARSFTNILSAILLCKYIKEVYDKPVILGGEINNLLLKLNSEFFLFDYAILGSGEGAVHDLLLSLDSERSLDNIKGLVHWVKGKKVINEGSYLKLLIKPDFKGLPLDLYRWSPPKVLDKHIPDEKCNKILILPFQFIEGCPNECAYCIRSNSLNFLKPAEVVRILKELSKDYNTNNFIFFSNTLNISKSYLEELCECIISSGLSIRWSDCFRPENLDHKLVLKMREAGCIRAVFGLDTCSKRLLNYTGRNIDLEKCGKIIKDSFSSGIWTKVNLIVGLPTETKEDIKANLGFLKLHRCQIDKVAISAFFLDKKSKMMVYPEKFGIQNVKKLDFPINFIHYPYFEYSFDEIDGLKWESKLEHIYESMNDLTFSLPSHMIPIFLVELPLLYYLYSNIKDDFKVKSAYRDYLKLFNRRFILSHPFYSLSSFFSSKNIKSMWVKLRRLS